MSWTAIAAAAIPVVAEIAGGLFNSDSGGDGSGDGTDWGALLGKAAQYGLAALSAEEQAKITQAANDENFAIAMQNYGLQRELFELQKETSQWQQDYLTEQQGYQRENDAYNRSVFEDALARQLEGRTTREGSTKYVPGQGWVTELSPTSEKIAQGNDRELLRQLTVGAQRNEATEANKFDQNIAADTDATRLRKDFGDVQRQDPQALARMLLAASTSGRNERMDEVEGMVNMAGIRRGAGADSLMRQISDRANSGADAYGKAAAKAKLDALGYVDSKYNADRSNTAELYNMFASRAGASASPTPSNVSIQGPGMPSGPSTGPTSSGGGPSPAISLPSGAPEMPYTGNPYSADANMYAGLSSLIGSSAQSAADDAKWEQLSGLLKTNGASTPGILPAGSTSNSSFGGTQSQGSTVNRDNLPWDNFSFTPDWAS